MNTDWHDLIHRHIDGITTEEEAALLHDALKQDDAVARLYLRYMNLDVALEAHATSSEAVKEILISRDAAAASRPPHWLSWRPLTAAVAGLVIGLFSASMVFAYAVPRMMPDQQRIVSLFRDGFEDAEAAFGHGFPRVAGGWSGDHLKVVEAGEGKSPKEGLRMVRLSPVEERKFCAAVRLVDLAEFPPGSDTESLTVEVTASFHGMDSERQDRNQIRLAAFAEPPADVRSLWNTDVRLGRALLHVARTVETKPGDDGWQTLQASMVIPAGTRSLVIHLGASIADDSAPKSPHFIDDVQVRFTAHEEPLQ